MGNLERSKNKKSGVWIMRVENSCKLCAFEHIDEVHLFAYESGASLETIIRHCEERYDFTISKATLSRHFNNHFIRAENRAVDMSALALSPSFSRDVSLNGLLEQIDKREANFFDSVSHLVKSKLVQYKTYEDLSGQIKDELDKTTLSDSGDEISGIIMTDRHTSDLFKRFAYLEKEKNIINSEIADMIFKAQNVIVKTDQEYVKNFVQMTKKFLIQSLVNQLANLLVDLSESGVINSQQRSAIAVSVVALMERFEVEMKTDILFQKSLELLRDEEVKSNGGE